MEQTVFIVDDDPAVLLSTVRLLEADGWHAEGYDCSETFLENRDPLATGCLLLDVMLPGLDGLELQQRLNETGSSLPIIFLTGEGDIPTSVRAIKSGATDFLTKPVPAEALLSAVRKALQEGENEQRERAERALLEQRLLELSPREREVLIAIAAGKLNKQIASDLGIVVQTVKFHRHHLMERMQARSAAELMYMAAKLGLSPGEGANGGR